MAQSANDETMMKARVRRADQRGSSFDLCSAGGGMWDAVIGGSFGARLSMNTGYYLPSRVKSKLTRADGADPRGIPSTSGSDSSDRASLVLYCVGR